MINDFDELWTQVRIDHGFEGWVSSKVKLQNIDSVGFNG